MLRGLRFPYGQIGLKQVDAGRGTVPLRVVTRRDELDDFPRVAGHAEVTGNGHEHVRPVPGGGEHLLVEGHGASGVLEFERFARLLEASEDAGPARGRGFRHWCGGGGLNFSDGLRSWRRW